MPGAVAALAPVGAFLIGGALKCGALEVAMLAMSSA